MNDTLDWNLIGAYLAVRRHGSLSAAARALGLSQPTVRRQVEELERRLGTPLFTRDTQGLTPVTAADDLVALAETIDATSRAFVRAATGDPVQIAGQVRISCPAVFAVEILPDVIASLTARHPGLAIELAVTNRVEDIQRHEADIAVRLVAPAQDRIVARKVAPVEVGFFVAPGAVAAAVAGLDLPSLLATAPFITDDRRDLIARGFAALGLPPPARAVLRTDDDLAQLAALRAGVGVGICQVRVGARSGLIRLSPDVALHVDAWVVTHEDLRRIPRIRTTLDALVAALS